MEHPDISRLSDYFLMEDDSYTYKLLPHGHIHKTFRISRNGIPCCILQNLNSSIFTDIDGLMENYERISRLVQDIVTEGNQVIRIPRLIPAINGSRYYHNKNSGYWRLITFINGADSDRPGRSIASSLQCGLAFGAFLSGISVIDPHSIKPVLPDFHSLEKRFRQFSDALTINRVNKADRVKAEIGFVQSRYPELKKIDDLMSSNILPLRLVHNDTKRSNIIFSEAGLAVGVIDLDTVMPGSPLFDFGDAIRSLANPSDEDEPDLTRVGFEIGHFRAFAEGYLKSASKLLVAQETDLLAESALFMTYMIGLRFLTDYLNGNVYYHTNYPDHNLVRARVQFRMLHLMQPRLEQMRHIVQTIRQNLA